jgi:hypothetical protein
VKEGAPAGWFPSPDPQHAGRFARYWDGARWTEHLVEIDAGDGGAGEPDGPLPPATALAPPRAEAGAAPPATASGIAQRRWARLPLTILVLSVSLLGSAFLIETIPADGPVGYSLIDETSANRLVNPPSVRASVGAVSQDATMRPRADDVLRQIGEVRWNRTDLLEVEIIPFYPGEQGLEVVIDVGGNGTNAFAQNRFVRIDVVARDASFDVTVRRPVRRGFQVRQEVLLMESIRRGNEASLNARFLARQAAEREILRLRAECETSEALRLAEAASAILSLDPLLQEVYERLGIFTQDSIALDDWLRKLRLLVAELRAHSSAASEALDGLSGPLADLMELSALIEVHERHVDAWETYRERLNEASRIRGRDLRFDAEQSVIFETRFELETATDAAQSGLSRAFAAETVRVCETLHPIP